MIKFFVMTALCISITACIPGTPKYKADRLAYKTPDELKHVSNSALCVAVFYHEKNTNIVSEINSRNLITENDWKTVWNKKIKIGMSLCALRAAWGPATRQHVRTGSSGSSVQRVYTHNHYGGYSKTYVYLKNGVVTSWTR